MLQDRPWREVAEFCSYSCQVDSLSLLPWEYPPGWIRNIEAALSAPEDAKRIGDA